MKKKNREGRRSHPKLSSEVGRDSPWWHHSSKATPHKQVWTKGGQRVHHHLLGVFWWSHPFLDIAWRWICEVQYIQWICEKFSLARKVWNCVSCSWLLWPNTSVTVPVELEESLLFHYSAINRSAKAPVVDKVPNHQLSQSNDPK